MKIVRNRGDARDLPARHHFAIFRLAAFLRLRRAQPDPREIVLAIQSYQSTNEVLLVGTWFFGTSACYLASLLDGWPRTLTVPLGFAASVVLFQVVFIAFALTIAPHLRAWTGSSTKDNAGLNGAFCILLLGMASAWFLREESWLRPIAWLYFFCLAVNGSAAILLRLLRPRVERLEASYGGDASGA